MVALALFVRRSGWRILVGILSVVLIVILLKVGYFIARMRGYQAEKDARFTEQLLESLNQHSKISLENLAPFEWQYACAVPTAVNPLRALERQMSEVLDQYKGLEDYQNFSALSIYAALALIDKNQKRIYFYELNTAKADLRLDPKNAEECVLRERATLKKPDSHENIIYLKGQ